MSGSGPWQDLERPPLRAAALAAALAPDGWRVEVLERTGSTNAVVAERARAGEDAGLVVVAEEQTAGRGRLDRTWTSPPRAGLTLSVLLRPRLPVERWGWLPLLAGLAVAEAVEERTGLAPALKWPNDVLVEGKKLCGLLAEVPEPGAVVLGVGLNVTTTAQELPRPDATSLRLAGAAETDRDPVLRALLRRLGAVLGDGGEEPSAAQQRYRARCATLGQQVRLDTPAGPVTGVAEDVDAVGRLVVDGVPHAAGDVVHLRT